MFAELRPKTKWTAVGFSLGRRLESGRLSRKVVSFGKKYFHVINMTEPGQVDDQVLEWLVEAYHLAGRTNGRRSVDVSSLGDGMVPEDVEDIF